MIRSCFKRCASPWMAVGVAALLSLGMASFGQTPAAALTWEQIKARFEAVNPTLIAARANIDEARANEITASLRPNPDFSLSTDGFQLAPNLGIWRPLSGVVLTPSISYTHERQHKRELRVESAKKSTVIAESSYADIKRGLLYNLRNSFVGVLQARAVYQNATTNLAYWKQELTVNQKRFDAGDLAKLDLSKLQLEQYQFETDLETANLNLKTSKIQIQQLVVDRTPIDQFDVNGPYEYAEKLMPLESFRMAALEGRPDLKQAIQNVELARTNHQLAIANGSTDPTWGVWYSHNASFANAFANNTAGFSVSIPLRFFSDRNQGEKARTQVDIGRNEKLRDAAEAQVYSDVDSAYATLQQALNLLGRSKEYYLPLSGEIRDKTRDAFQHGGASLLEYLDAEKSYRDTNLSYLNLIGSYLTAAAQMNQAVGREVLP